MSTFLDIASPLAGRGFRVFPLVPENKMPVRLSWGDHFDAATTDISALKQWGQEVPRANVGLSPDETFAFWKRTTRPHCTRRAPIFRPRCGTRRG
jgi:Bifunctional DNA primase/polymerase, N-terminal